MKYSDNIIYQGEWFMDKKHGKGKIIDYEGNILKNGIWEEGKLI